MSQCWVHRFFCEMKFIIEKNQFLTYAECHMFVGRIVKKYCQKKKEFEEIFSREKLDGLMIDVGKKWKLCLIDHKFNAFIFKII